MFLWTEESIKWIDQAAIYTGYYKKLANAIKEYLSPSDHICEIACGTGHLAMELSPYVRKINAVDISEQAIEFAMKKKSTLKEGTIGGNVYFKACDWQEYCTDKNFDVIIFTYFGIQEEQWKALQDSTQRCIIAALPFEKTWRRSSEFKKEEVTDEKKENCIETVEGLLKVIEINKLNYEMETLTIEFGQPFNNEKEIEDYLDHYYPSLNENERSEKKNKIQKKGRIVYLPKKKNLAIIKVVL